MDLLLTVEVPAQRFQMDVIAELDPWVSVGVLSEALTSWVAARNIAVPKTPALIEAARGGRSRELDPQLTVFDSGLVSGATVVLVEAVESYRFRGKDGAGPRPDAMTVSLDVTSGVDAGRTFVLGEGRHLVGRAAEAEVSLGDPAVSAHQFTIVVEADLTVRLEPSADARNPTYVSAEQVVEPRVLRRDEAVFAGNSQLVLRGAVLETLGRRDRLGQVAFNPLPYHRPVIRERHLDEIAAPPERPGRRRFPIAALIVPLLAAVLIVALTHQVAFITIAVLSPLMMVSNHVSEGRSSRANYARDKAEFEERIDKRVDEVANALDSERRERMAAAPDVGLLARQAVGRLGRLWERPRASVDFLQLRVGLGSRPSRVETPLAPGGDPELRDHAAARLAAHNELPLVPITVSLDKVGVLGLYPQNLPQEARADPGNAGMDPVTELASALVSQAVLLHSPEQLVVVAAIPTTEEARWEWLKWLPHTRSATSPLEGEHLVDEHGVVDLVRRLATVVSSRSGPDQVASAPWPRVLFLLHELTEPDRAALSALLDVAQSAGILCLWVGESESQLPRQCQATISAVAPHLAESLLRYTDPERDDEPFLMEGTGPELLDRVARALAPVRDVSAATVTTGIPRVVSLVEVPAIAECDPRRLAERWAAGDRSYSLSAAIGMGADEPFVIDLVSEGPHALIAGTSGAGKSELLQTLVCALAAGYSPRRLNFLFIDYKGGASSAPFARMPHTVGSVSNLDERLALRALASLRAELRRRMSLLEGRAKDLAEMLEVAPEDAPPSLVIVVDEFATLVKEIPEFVAGMVDVAQRGRSLGIHLVLATQRPTGAVNDNILANTNLRIALRVLDGADSTAVIGTKDAAGIPVPLRGRAFARTGPGALTPFQCAWSGAPYRPDQMQTPVVVQRFRWGGSDGTDGIGPSRVLSSSPPEESGGATADRDRTQLDALVEATVAANAALRLAPPDRPWVEPLPPHVGLTSLLECDPAGEERRRLDPGRWVVLGLGDRPAEQRQAVVEVDLESDGGLLVFGTGGSGKTTLLRSIAAGLCAQGDPDDVRIFGLDFAGRSLAQLEELPHVAAVATGDDLELVTRMLTVLRVELERRRRLLADARVESMSALRAHSDVIDLPRLVLLVDGYSGFHATFENGTLYTWVLEMGRLITDGRNVGIHVVLTNNRLLGIPTAVTSAVAARVVMRMATVDELTSLGVPREAAAGAALGDGRCFAGGSTECQIATVSEDPSGVAQAAAIHELAGKLLASGMSHAPGLLALPSSVEARGEVSHPLGFPLGLADLTLETVEVDLTYQNFVVVGPPLSGRSNALGTAVAGIRASSPDVRLVGLGALTSPLAKADCWDIAGFGRAHQTEALVEAAMLVAGDEGEAVRMVVVIDSIEDVDSMENGMHLESLVRSDAVRVMAACDNGTLERAYSGWMTELKRNRTVLVLQPGSVAEVEDQTRARPSLRPGQEFPPGRGVVVSRGQATLVQVALQTTIGQTRP